METNIDVVSYKMFTSSSEFEEWQVQNVGVKMISITPIIGSVKGDVDTSEAQENIEVQATVNVVVQYWKTMEG